MMVGKKPRLILALFLQKGWATDPGVAREITQENSHLILWEAHSSVTVTEEGNQCSSRCVLFVVIGCAIPVAQLDHPIIVGKLTITQPQVPRLTTKMNTKMSLWKCHGAGAL